MGLPQRDLPRAADLGQDDMAGEAVEAVEAVGGKNYSLRGPMSAFLAMLVT